jgi:hypothetical protein
LIKLLIYPNTAIITIIKSGDIKGETESTIVAAQDQAISTNILRIKF